MVEGGHIFEWQHVEFRMCCLLESAGWEKLGTHSILGIGPEVILGRFLAMGSFAGLFVPFSRRLLSITRIPEFCSLRALGLFFVRPVVVTLVVFVIGHVLVPYCCLISPCFDGPDAR